MSSEAFEGRLARTHQVTGEPFNAVQPSKTIVTKARRGTRKIPETLEVNFHTSPHILSSQNFLFCAW